MNLGNLLEYSEECYNFNIPENVPKDYGCPKSLLIMFQKITVIVQKAAESAQENTRKCLKKITGNVRKIIRLTYNIAEQFPVLDSNTLKGLLAANISTNVFSMK